MYILLMHVSKIRQLFQRAYFGLTFKYPCSSYKQLNFSLKDLQVLMLEDFVFCPYHFFFFASIYHSVPSEKISCKEKEKKVPCPVSLTHFLLHL